ncbi:hypothetical protein [Heyndrickxia vini]|uniref:hypothetical protein n=1 Tax=Heyndrickxia vini TaxID=1476025 RepID=UPI001FE7AFA4|nr:hypothetical protein [Heyndrickxia vini]
MPQEKLTIVPIKLHPKNKRISSSTSSITGSSSICTIKIANAEDKSVLHVDETYGQIINRFDVVKPVPTNRCIEVSHAKS